MFNCVKILAPKLITPLVIVVYKFTLAVVRGWMLFVSSVPVPINVFVNDAGTVASTTVVSAGKALFSNTGSARLGGG